MGPQYTAPVIYEVKGFSVMLCTFLILCQRKGSGGTQTRHPHGREITQSAYRTSRSSFFKPLSTWWCFGILPVIVFYFYPSASSQLPPPEKKRKTMWYLPFPSMTTCALYLIQNVSNEVPRSHTATIFPPTLTDSESCGDGPFCFC